MNSILSAVSPVKRLLTALFVLAAVASCASMQAQSLSFAPVLYNVASVNGTQANNVNALSFPTVLTADQLGNMYILDSGHMQIRKVDPTGTSSLYAGLGTAGYLGDGGQATSATFYMSGIASDANGNIYIADTYNYAIRRIDAATRIVTTIAGGHGTGTPGEGVAATSAQLTLPGSIAVDNSGNYYFTDGTVVRRVDASGILTTYAGGGTPTSGNGDGGQATAASFSALGAIAMDSTGKLYIIDSNTVRVVDPASRIITKFAGTGAQSHGGDGGQATLASFSAANALATDSTGNVYITETYYIRVVNSSGVISSLAGNGTSANGTGANFVPDGSLPTSLGLQPNGVTVDSNSNVYFSIRTLNGVYKIVLHPERFPMTAVGTSSPSQRIIIQNKGASDITWTSLTLAGDFANVPFNSYLSNNYACQATTTGTHTISAGFGNYCQIDVVFTPTQSGIRSFALTMTSNDTPTTLTENLTSTGLASTLSTTGGQIFTLAGKKTSTSATGDGGLATASDIVSPDGLVTDSAGNIYFVEYGYCRVRKIDATTGILTTIAGINPSTCDSLNRAYNQPDGLASQAELYGPSSIAMDKNGNLFIGDSGHDQIRKITTGGQIIRVAGTGAHGCSWAGDGGPAINAEFCAVSGIAVDSAGDIFFTDSGDNMIREVDAAGVIHVLAGNTTTVSSVGGYSPDGLGTSMTLYRPWGIVLDAAQKNLYFVENTNLIVRKLNLTTDQITTVAGRHNTIGYSGDGGLATGATLNSPYGLAIDAADNLYVADSGNNVVRKINSATGIITTVAGNFVQGGLYNGDGIPATSAGLNYPENVTIDGAGNLILSERTPLIREVSPNGMLSFGNQLVSTTSASQTVTISNIGNTPMTFGTPGYGVSGDFAFVPGGTCTFTGSLAVGSSCTVQVNFTPTATGYRYGLLAYYDNGVASPQLMQLRGVGTAPAQPVAQSITLVNPRSMVYGAAAFAPVATSTSGLTVTVTVQSGPATISGGIVSLTGVGTVVLAANQAGNASYLAAPQVTQSFSVTPATLTVTASPLSLGYGATIPTTFATTITGYVNNDPSSVVTGAAAGSTTATSTSVAGPYPITLTQGTLVAANYTFTFVAGTLTIGQGTQTITIPSIAYHTYGDAPFLVTASASSGLPVTLTIKSGNATISNGTVTLTGVGVVVVQAVQAGNTNYAAASNQTSTFVTSPAVLTVTAANATMVYASTVPTLTGTITGYVYNETSSVVSGAATYPTTVSSTSAASTYTITPNVTGLSATNYTFVAATGTLTVTPAPLTVTPNAATRSYGAANPAFTGTPTGLKNSDNPIITYSSTATTTSAPGTYTIGAIIGGTSSTNYTLTVTPVNLTVTKANTSTTLSVTQVLDVEGVDTLVATVTSLTTGTPTGTVTFNEGIAVVGTATYVQGTGYVLTTSNFTGGVHDITATYNGDTNFFPSTTASSSRSTVGDYSFSASPSSLTITAGGTGTTTITFTPTFGWTGTQTPVCTGLKAGMTCTFLPTTLTSNGSNTPSSSVLTITTTAAHAVSVSGLGWSRLSLAGMLVLLPVCVMARRKRGIYGVTLFLFLAMVAMMQTGCGTGAPAANPNATPVGTSSVSVGFASGGDPAHALNLSITIN